MDHLGLRLNNAPADSWRKGVVSWTWQQAMTWLIDLEMLTAP